MTCTPGVPTYSSFWVGIGGYSVESRALEQIGTEVDCTRSGKVRSTAWYELVPAGSARIKLSIKPGDLVLAQVKVRRHRVSLSLYDATTRHGFHRTVRAPIVDTSSAEWIVEAPSECVGLGACETLPLANFGSAGFSSASATTTTGHDGSISDPAWRSTKIKLVPQGRRFVIQSGGDVPLGEALPSVLGAGGSAFAVSYSQVTLGGTPAHAARATAEGRRQPGGVPRREVVQRRSTPLMVQ